jgi:Ran GTPase-activating protein (RanGAP) involved in mRNA processing and transport
MYKNFENILVIYALLFATQEIGYAAPPAPRARAVGPMRSSGDAGHKDYNESAPSENPEEENCYPFTKASQAIAPETVVGLRIKKGKVFQLASDKTYFLETLPEDFDSDLNFFKKFTKLISVEFSGISLTEEMLENLQKFLPKELKSLSVHSCHMEKQDYELLADIYRKRPDLASISLVDPSLTGEESTIILKVLEDRANIEFLNIIVEELNKDGIEHLANLLSNSAKVLRELSLGCDKVADDSEGKSFETIFKAASLAKGLTKLELSFISMFESDFAHIAESVCNFTKLISLKMYIKGLRKHNHISLFENMEKFQESLSKLTKLEVFDISSMFLPSDIIRLISQSIESMRNLKTLNVSGNTLDEKSAESLSKAIAETHLITLMASNCGMDSAAFSALCKSLQSTSLEQIYVGGNQIKDGAKNLPIANMKELRVVDFSQNDMSYDDAMAFIELTKGHPNLYIVSFKDNSEIDSMSAVEKTIKSDQLQEWKAKNHPDRQVIFFGL